MSIDFGNPTRRFGAAALALAFGAAVALPAAGAQGTPTAGAVDPCQAIAAGTPWAMMPGMPGFENMPGMMGTPGAMMGGMMGGPMHTPGAMMGGRQGTPGAMMGQRGGMPDLAFIDMMIPHHAGAIGMAQVAQSRAEHPELRELAQRIVDAQEREIGDLQRIRAAEFPDAPPMGPGMMEQRLGELMGGATPAAGMGMGGMMMMDPAHDVAALCNAGGPFDLAFIDMMIPHHESAIAMAQAVVTHGSSPEVRALAEQVIADQTREIAQMREWRAAWFPQAATPTP